jgi:hypothetical protein
MAGNYSFATKCELSTDLKKALKQIVSKHTRANQKISRFNLSKQREDTYKDGMPSPSAYVHLFQHSSRC